VRPREIRIKPFAGNTLQLVGAPIRERPKLSMSLDFFSLRPSQILHLNLALSEPIARMGEKRNAYRILVGEPEGKKSLGGPRSRWVNNRKTYRLRPEKDLAP
jgi:hypothetical protein